MKINKKIKIILLSTTLVLGSMFLTACKNGQDQTDNKDQKSGTEDTIDTGSQATKKEDKNNQAGKDEDKGNKNTKQAKIIYYTFDINTEKLTENTKEVDEVSVGNIVKAMIENNMLQKGVEVNSAKVTEIDGVRTLVVDMNDKFINFNQGSTAESLTLRCFANSLVKTFKVEQVKLTVDGQNYSSGHIALKDGEYLKYQ